ncbi:hypothetical protein KR084_012050 [Drosophila pseudotakahashii]|nr:hypothetical protein KR084_012050 [Drosophila pseudotakahashii]
MSKRNPPPSARSSTGQRKPSVQKTTLPPPPPKPPPPPPVTAPAPPPKPATVPPPTPPKTTPVQPPPPPPQKPTQPRVESPILSPITSSVASRSQRSNISLKRRHLIWVYMLHAVLSTSAVIQLVTLRVLKQDFGVLISPTIPSFLWLFLAVVCVLVLAFVYFANQCPCNCLLAIVIVELMVLFVNSEMWPRVSLSWVAGVLIIVLILSILLYMMGIFLPLKVLPGPVFMIILTLCCLVIVVSIYVIVYLNGNRYMLRYVSMVSLLYAATLILFTITVVHQRRFEYMDRSDNVLQAAVLAMILVYMIHVVSTIVRFGQHLVDKI